jgi:DNA-binding response OmpR family regulator
VPVPASPRVLVIDDDPTVREVVSGYLRQAGCEVDEAADGPSGLATYDAVPADLVVLDLMLPGIDGLEVFRRLRSRAARLPVLMLTARGDEADRVLGLEVGADDYVAKPFSARELVLRVQALLRRSGPAEADPAAGTPPETDPGLRDGDLVLDVRGRTATRDGEPLSLTTREFDLLRHFLSTPGRAWSRADLMRQVWGWEYGDESTVTVHVRRLREKVEPDPGRPRRLVTVWGVGYRWDRDDA